jgi:hypothetical protein
MLSRIKNWLIRVRDKRQLADKIKSLSKQDSLIYTWCDDQKD